MDEGSPEPDILDQGSGPRLPRLPRLPFPSWRPSRNASILAAATLVVGLAVGYAVGHGHGQGRGTFPPPESPSASSIQVSGGFPQPTIVTLPPPPAEFFGQPLTENPGTCSVQVGHNLELGIPVTNQSDGTVLLQSVKAVPQVSGMLKVLSWRWTPCGFDHDGELPDIVALGPGETTWVTVVVQPLVACPGPAPVQFQVTYSLNNHKSTFMLHGFSDLSAVHYSGCPTPAA